MRFAQRISPNPDLEPIEHAPTVVVRERVGGAL